MLYHIPTPVRSNAKNAKSGSSFSDLVAGERPLEVAAVVPLALLLEPLVAAGAVAVVVALGHGDEIVVKNLKHRTAAMVIIASPIFAVGAVCPL